MILFCSRSNSIHSYYHMFTLLMIHFQVVFVVITSQRPTRRNRIRTQPNYKDRQAKSGRMLGVGFVSTMKGTFGVLLTVTAAVE